MTNEPSPWKHVANEWADMAINGLQHLRNLVEYPELRSPEKLAEALANMESCLAHCRSVNDPVSTAEFEAARRADMVAELMREGIVIHDTGGFKLVSSEKFEPIAPDFKLMISDALSVTKDKSFKTSDPIVDHVKNHLANPWTLDLHGQPDSVGGSF